LHAEFRDPFKKEEKSEQISVLFLQKTLFLKLSKERETEESFFPI
jgi:hypothetical protein